MSPPPLLEVKDLHVTFPARRGQAAAATGRVRAVDGVSFSLAEGETLCLVGESGSGKTTLGRAILGLVEASSGDVLYRGESLLQASTQRLRALRRELQMVFQDPFSSLNPRWTVAAIVGEGPYLAGLRDRRALRRRVDRALEQVGLDPAAHRSRYPHEFSGGQRQRIGIARALILEPKLVVLDEPVSSLDVSVRGAILALLEELQAQTRHTSIFITHDLSLALRQGLRMAVLYAGRLAEVGPVERLGAAPHHPYTQALLASAPVSHPRERRDRAPSRGEPPSPLAPPTGCRFHPRCPLVRPECATELPPARALGAGHVSWCWLEPRELPT